MKVSEEIGAGGMLVMESFMMALMASEQVGLITKGASKTISGLAGDAMALISASGKGSLDATRLDKIEAKVEAELAAYEAAGTEVGV